MLLRNRYAALMFQADIFKSRPVTGQCDRILARLEAARGADVNMAELARIGSGNPDGFCMVHSRIADLRKRGHPIPKARVERQPDGAMHSFYRLLTSSIQHPASSIVP